MYRERTDTIEEFSFLNKWLLENLLIIKLILLVSYSQSSHREKEYHTEFLYYFQILLYTCSQKEANNIFKILIYMCVYIEVDDKYAIIII